MGYSESNYNYMNCDNGFTNTGNIYDQSYNNYDTNMEKDQMQEQMQLELDIQLYQRRQVRYNNVFERFYNKLNEYLSFTKNKKIYPKEHKGILLDLLDYYAAMVQLWNKEYPEYEPQLKKGYDKEKILADLEKRINDKKTDKNDVKIFKKFYSLLKGEEQTLYDDEEIASYFPDNKTTRTKEKVIEDAKKMLKETDKLIQKNKKIEEGGFQEYPIDPRLEHLRRKHN